MYLSIRWKIQKAQMKPLQPTLKRFYSALKQSVAIFAKRCLSDSQIGLGTESTYC